MPGLRKQNVSPLRTEIAPPAVLVRTLGSGFFTGYFPVAPGTAASLFALLLYLIPGFESPFVILPLISVALLLGAGAAAAMEKAFGHDPSVVTIDEVVGMWISLFLLPKLPIILLSSFIVFRILDILKPWPARAIDRRSGGWSIMLDDVVAGIYANLVLRLLLVFI